MKRVYPYFILGILLAAPAAFGLNYLIMETEPYLFERWLLYILIFLFVTGLVLPVMALLNRYFFTAKRIDPPAVVREAIGCGMIADLLLWFQMGRVLSPLYVLVMVGGFVTAEVLLRAREAMGFRSNIDGDDESDFS